MKDGGVKILERLKRRERDSFETGHEENKREREGRRGCNNKKYFI
jgi:hypothetical protein